MQSRPNIPRLTLMALYLFLIGAPICMLLLEWLTGVIVIDIILLTYLTLLIICIGFVIILNELPILTLTIDDGKIVVRNLLTRSNYVFLLEDIHSFRISIEMRGFRGFVLHLILLQHGAALEPISLRYVGNLDEIITELEKHLRNLTEDQYGFLRYIRKQQIK
jgi:hypothetical protein